MSTELLVFNPLPWPRTISGPVSENVVSPRGTADDPMSGRHFQDRQSDGYGTIETLHGHDGPYGPETVHLPETKVPGYGWTKVNQEQLSDPTRWKYDERATVETDRYRITFDRETGGIRSWYDFDREHEWVDSSAEHPLCGIVHERVADETRETPRRSLFNRDANHEAVTWGGLENPDRGWCPDWHATRDGASSVDRHRVYDAPDGFLVRQLVQAPVGQVAYALWIPDYGEGITVEAAWESSLDTHPQGTYLTFPFAIDDPTPRVDVGEQAMVPGQEQLPGSCHDYYTAQRWVAMSGDPGGITVGCQRNPLFQFGGFTFGANRQSSSVDSAQVLGWVTNNYWETNFRGRQPGAVRAQYHLRPHDAFDEAFAHQFGATTTHHRPLVTNLGEESVEATWPREASLLDLPEPPIMVRQIKASTAENVARRYLGPTLEERRGITLVLQNASDTARTASIDSALINLQSAEKVENKHENAQITFESGSADLHLGPRTTLRCRLHTGK